MKRKQKVSALYSLVWANRISVLFSLLFLIFGGLLSLGFNQNIPGVLALFLGACVNILLFLLFLPSAKKEAFQAENRPEAVKRINKCRFYQIVCLTGYLLLSILFLPVWTNVFSIGTILALLPVTAGVFMLGVGLTVFLRDDWLTTAEERKQRALNPRPRGMNLLSGLMVVLAVLSMQVYRVVWLLTAQREEWISGVTMIGFAVFYISVLLFPLFILKRTNGRERKKIVRLCAVRNMLTAIGFLVMNLSVSFYAQQNRRTVQIDPVVFTVGLLWMVLAYGIFEFLLRTRAKKIQA